MILLEVKGEGKDERVRGKRAKKWRIKSFPTCIRPLVSLQHMISISTACLCVLVTPTASLAIWEKSELSNKLTARSSIIITPPCAGNAISSLVLNTTSVHLHKPGPAASTVSLAHTHTLVTASVFDTTSAACCRGLGVGGRLWLNVRPANRRDDDDDACSNGMYFGDAESTGGRKTNLRKERRFVTKAKK